MGLFVAAEVHAGPKKSPSERTSDGVRRFSDGVWVDWAHREVLLDARVVLRKGPLELLACSPHTREHESILVVHARPRDIYHAMGLVGLEPGSPVRFDPNNHHLVPPSGELLRLRIRLDYAGMVQTVPASAWLRRPSSSQSLDKVDWVFAGSYSRSDGRFASDEEGTIVALVDFESALIAVGALHTSNNEALWLEAHTDAIPPIATRCRLMISAAMLRLLIKIAPDGSISLDGQVVEAKEVHRRFHTLVAGGRAGQIVLQPMSGTLDRVVQATLEKLERAGLNRASIRVRSNNTESDAGSAVGSPKKPELQPQSGQVE